MTVPSFSSSAACATVAKAAQTHARAGREAQRGGGGVREVSSSHLCSGAARRTRPGRGVACRAQAAPVRRLNEMRGAT
jgi:hypothetical protein